MAETVCCPMCRSQVTHEDLPPELDDRFFPMACAIRKGMGVPVVAPPVSFTVMLDGTELKDCVGFDRRMGIAWVMSKDIAGNLVMRDETFAIEHRSGIVTLEPRA
jgi:hypothetical protein